MKRDYDLIVIGGGAAGLTSAGIGASFGAKTAMIEANKPGGDCTWTGCIPSKSLLHIAGQIHQLNTAQQFLKYPKTSSQKIDFKKVIEKVHRIREEVYYEADRPEIFEQMGVDVIQGYARFTDSHTLQVSGKENESRTLTARKFIIATGSKARVLPVPGLADINYLTNENLFELNELPEHLAIVGGGPIGCEMCQAFNRLGSKVTLIEASERILPKDHPELTPILQQALAGEGVEIHTGAEFTRASGKSGKITIEFRKKEVHEIIKCSHLLIAAGRTPNVMQLGLENAGVKFSVKGIETNNRCKTNVSHIFAAGDCTGKPAFTHIAENMAKIAAANALLRFPQKQDLHYLPWTTFTQPELAHVGATEAELKQKKITYKVYRFPFTKVDRALAEDLPAGWIRVYAKPLSGKILGADVLGESAGEIISEYALAMKNGISLRKIADTIHPYPTYGLAARRAADQWYIQQQKPWITRLIQKIFGYRGQVQEPDPDRIM